MKSFWLQLRRERHQRDVARTLDCFAQPSLVARARARHAAGKNLAAILYERVQHVGFLVVNVIDLIHAETAHLALAEKLALAALARAGPSAGTAFTGTATAASAG